MDMAHPNSVYCSDAFIKLLQGFCGICIVADLGELNAEAILGNAGMVQPPSCVYDDFFWFVR